MGVVSYDRVETLADFPAAVDFSLTRAIVQYRAAQLMDRHGLGIDDIGVALIIDGDYAAAAEALDLGSGRPRHLDLSGEIVVLDWVYASTLDYVRILLRAPTDLLSEATDEERTRPLRQYCQNIALGMLARLGFNPLTRASLLRIGFRDIVRDLDPNEHAVVRIAAGPHDRIDACLDVDNNALQLGRSRAAADPGMESVLAGAFPGSDVRRLPPSARARFQLRFPLPCSFQDARDLLRDLRSGLLRVFAHYEPERSHIARHALDIFGPRDTLARLDPAAAVAAPPSIAPVAGVA